MKIVKKHFNTLTPTELHSIYKLRTSVFVVEQNCAYQEVDDADKGAEIRTISGRWDTAYFDGI